MSASPTDTAFWEICQKYLEECETRKHSRLWFKEKKNFIRDHLRPWYARGALSITRPEIEGVLNQKAKTSPYMANKYLKFMKSIFNFAIHREILLRNPCFGIEKFGVEMKIRRLPSLTDLKKVILCATLRDQKFLELLYATAARGTEILGLKWQDCGSDWIILRTRKHHQGGAYREDKIPIGPKCQAILTSLKPKYFKPEDYVFVHPRYQTRYNRRPKLMRSLCGKAGVKPFGFHDIRALAASKLASEGIPLKAIQGRLRHARITTTDRYIHSIGEGEQRAAMVLDGVA